MLIAEVMNFAEAGRARRWDHPQIWPPRATPRQFCPARQLQIRRLGEMMIEDSGPKARSSLDIEDGQQPAEARLAERELTIERNLPNYQEIGEALYDIREERLYRVKGFRTFEDYCRHRWGWKSRQVAYNYVAAAQIAK